MIKGHSATGSKNQVQEEFLRLSDFRGVPTAMRDYPSGSSSSGSGREDSAETEPIFPLTPYNPQYQQSSLRGLEEYYGTSGTSGLNQSSPLLRIVFVDMLSPRCDSPTDPSVQYEYPMEFYPILTADTFESEMLAFYSL